MAKVKFTVQRIRSFRCPTGSTQAFLWDLEVPGLGLRVTKAGASSYIFQSRAQGKVFRMTIGAPRVWSLHDAQVEARRLKMLCDQGRDPRQVKAEGIAEDIARKIAFDAESSFQSMIEKLTARQAWDAYLQSPHPKWGETHLNDHLTASQRGGLVKQRGKGLTTAGPLASLLDQPLASITAQTVCDWIKHEKISRPTATLNGYRKFRAFIRWCAENVEYAVFVNQDCYSQKKVTDQLPAKRTKEGDCLQREQLSTWFQAVQNIGNPFIAAYLQVLLLTGARREEMSTLKWTDIDFSWNTIQIKDKVEGHRTIPLTPYVSSLLSNLKHNGNFVFFSAVAKSGHIEEPRKAHHSALENAGLPIISIHGLRRSFSTLSEWVDCPSGVVAQIMGHKPSAIAEKHYIRRPIDLLRQWHIRIETWILSEAFKHPNISSIAA